VRFALLHPATDDPVPRKTNDLSCVLRVSAGARSMLLTGDIERASEALLVARSPQSLRADVLLVPHHGSKTSSSEEFLAAVGPSMAVIPGGLSQSFRPSKRGGARPLCCAARTRASDRPRRRDHRAARRRRGQRRYRAGTQAPLLAPARGSGT
jgi:hypothetical protein